MIEITYTPMQSGLPTYIQTEESLQFTMQNIQHGSYRVTIKREGYHDFVHIVHLNSDLHFDIQMNPIVTPQPPTEEPAIIVKVDSVDITQTAIRIDNYTIPKPIVSLSNMNPKANLIIWE